jgi:hypothetical protein
MLHCPSPTGPSSLSTPADRRPLPRWLVSLLLIGSLFLPGSPARAQEVETTRLDPDFEVSLSGLVAAAPGLGFVASWGRGKISVGAFGHSFVVPELVMVAWLGADGRPLTPPRPLETPEHGYLYPIAVASAAPGEAIMAVFRTVGENYNILTRRFGFDGSAGPLHSVADCAAFGAAELLAVADGYWLIWPEGCDGPALRARRIDLSGEPVGEPITIAPASDEPRAFGAAARPNGGFWVAWERLGGAGPALLARRYSPGGAPATAAVAVRRRPTVGAEVAALPDGAALIGWEESRTLLIRRVDPEGALSGPPVPIGDPEAEEILLRLAASPGGVVAGRWLRLTDPQVPGPRPCILRLFDAGDVGAGVELELDTPCDSQDDLVFGPAGTLLVLAHEQVSAGQIILDQVYSRPRIAVLPAAELVPPPGPGFVPDAFPGFRFWVRIGGDEPAPRIGAPEPLCLPETACVSGALAGRTEVLLRIVGPKPNGYLWPTVVRFTTSTVEVWLERLATGERRYYRLDGAGPGSDELTGFFDRTGFLP